MLFSFRSNTSLDVVVKGFLLDVSTFYISRLSVKQVTLHDMGRPHPISWGSKRKDLGHQKEKQFCQQIAFRFVQQYRCFAGSLTCQPALRFLDLLTPTITQANSLKWTNYLSLYLSLSLCICINTHIYVVYVCFSGESWLTHVRVCVCGTKMIWRSIRQNNMIGGGVIL